MENTSCDKKTNPFFSVVIPTRNRAVLLCNTITSVLDQTFCDYELIVSDNSDNPDIVLNNLKSFPGWINNPKCKYLRPSNYMVMPDHWEFLTSHAVGDYVAILTDRFVMRPSALEVLAKRIKANAAGEPDIVVWDVQSGFSDQSGIQYTNNFTAESSLINSRDILSEFAEFSSWRNGNVFFNKLPRGMNSVYKRSLAKTIIEIHGRMFPPLSPDYSSAFLFMAYTENVLYLDLPLYMSHGNKSTGRNSLIYGIRMLDSEVDALEDCPLQLDTVFNSVVRDFIAIKNMVYPRMQDINIDVVGYFLSNYRELVEKELIGAQMNIKRLYSTWRKGLEELPCHIQEEINTGVRQLDCMRPNLLNAFRYKMTRRFGLDKVRDHILQKLCKWKYKRSGKRLYSNVLEAAQATDHFLRDP